MLLPAKKRVLTLIHAGFGGGVNSVVKDLAAEVTRTYGRPFSILTVNDVSYNRESNITADFSFDGDEQITQTVCNLWNQAGNTPVFLINGIGIDFAYANYVRSRGARILYIVHGDSDYYYLTAQHFRPIVDLYVAISSTIAQKLKEILGPETPLVTIHNSVCVPEVVQGERPADVIRLVYLGLVDNKLKGLDRAPAVIRELARKNIPFHLTVIGDGPYLPTLKSEMDASGAGSQVSFLGTQTRERAMELLSGQDILLLFSRSEGMNIAMLEAMARGVVPVIPVTSGATDVIEDGTNGFLIHQDSLTDMVGRISLLRTDTERWRVMSRTARQTIRTGFNLERTVVEYEALFSRLGEMGPWRGSVPYLVLRKDIFDLPIFSNLTAKMFRKMIKRVKTTKLTDIFHGMAL